MNKLTKTFVESIEPTDKEQIIRDSELKGFTLKVLPSGKKVYMLQYRYGRKTRKPKIGNHGEITAEHARKIAKSWLGKLAMDVDPMAQREQEEKNITINELFNLYIEERKPYTKPNYLRDSLRYHERFIKDGVGKIKASEVTRDDLAKLHNKLSKTKYQANRVLQLISATINFGIANQLIEERINPCSFVKKYKEDKKEVYLTNEQINRLFEVLDQEQAQQTEDEYLIAAIKVILLTGARKNEILTLKWSYINFDRKLFNLPDSKTGAKPIMVSDNVLKIIKTLKKQKDNEYVFVGKVKGSYWVNIRKPWLRISKKAGFEGVRIHDLRHTFASMGANAGLTLLEVGGMLGHKRSTTTERYAHLFDENKRKAVDKVTEVILNSNN